METKKIDKKRWLILVACCLINLCLGSVYAWSVFSSAMANYFNNVLGFSVTVGDLVIVYTICNAVGPITMISGGWINDKIGPKLVILIGGIAFLLIIVACGLILKPCPAGYIPGCRLSTEYDWHGACDGECGCVTSCTV